MTHRFPRVMRTLAGITAGLFVLTSALTAQPPTPAKPAAPSKSATAEPTLSPEELKAKQEENKKNFTQFKEALFRLATRLEKSERQEMKDQAKVIRQALDEVEKKGVDAQFANLVAGIASGKTAIDFGKLAAEDQQLVDTLKAIMALLEADGDGARLKAQIKELEAYLKELKNLTDQQKSAQARTESMKGDKDKLKNEQERLKDSAKDLAERMAGKKDDGNSGQGGGKKDDRAEGKGEPKAGDKAGEGKADTGEAKGSGKEGEGKEGKEGAGEGKGNGKEGKEGAGEGKGSGMGEGKEGKEGAAEGKGSEGKEGGMGDGQGKPSDGKEGSGKPGDGNKPGDGGKKPGDGAGKPGDGAKPGDGQGQGEGKGGQPGSESKGQGGEGKGQGKGQGEGKGGGKGSEGKGQGGEGKGSGKEGGQPPQGGQSGSKGGGQQGQPGQGGQGGQGGQQDKNELPGRKQVQEAIPHQGDASKKIDEEKRADAGKSQDKAIEKLEEAIKKLEERLKQLREEEIKKLLANVEARCQKMLAMQIEVYENTKGIDASRIKNGGEMTNVERQKSGQQSDKEGEIVADAERCLKLLESEGSAVAFAKVLEEVKQDMIAIQRRLNSSVVDKDTQSIEENVIAMLKEMVEALKKQQQQMQQQQQQQQSGQQKPQNQKLINLIAELKLIRSLQSQVNMRTKMYGDKEKAEQSKDQNVQLELRQLSARQQKLQEMIEKIASGENEK